MNFPQQTLDLAARLAAEFTQKACTLSSASQSVSLLLARSVYNHLHGRYGYGFREGLKQGYFIRWPHEIEHEWECIEAATYTYVLAEAAGLKPRMLNVKKWTGLDTGHETVDVLVEGKRILIDPLNSMFGPVIYDERGIVVEDNPLTEQCILQCRKPEEVPRKRIINRIDYYRSDEGILNLLRAGQSYNMGPTHRVFVHYDPQLRVFEQQMRSTPPFLTPVYYAERRQLSPCGPTKWECEAGIYNWADWATLVGKEPFWRVTHVEHPQRVTVTFQPPESKFEAAKTEITHEYLPLSRRGMAHWLLEIAYEVLLREKYPELYEDPRGNPGNRYVFEDREEPLRALAEKVDRLGQGITPETKGRYNETKKSYFSTVHLCQECDMERMLDFATLKLQSERLAKEAGMDLIVFLTRLLRRAHAPRQLEDLNITARRYINAHKYHFWYPNPDNWRAEVFHDEYWENLFARLERRGLLYEESRQPANGSESRTPNQRVISSTILQE